MTLIRKKPRSEARDRLAAAIEARRDLQNELSAINASLARLQALNSEPAKIEAAISAIDASGADALAAWATTGEGAVPTPNAEKRAELVADLSVAKPPEHRAKIAEAQRGKPKSPEQRARMSTAQAERHARARLAAIATE
jgi:hypothetical protein